MNGKPNPQSCNRKDDLVTYLYGEATPTESRAFEQHVKDCNSCREELEAFTGVRRVMQTWEVETVPRIEIDVRPTFWQTVKQFFVVTPVWGKVVMAGACGLVLLACLNVRVTVGRDGVTFSTGLQPAPQVVETRVLPTKQVEPPVTMQDPQPTTVARYDEKAIRVLVEELIKASESRQDGKLASQFEVLATQLKARNDAELIKAVSALKREQRQQLLNVLHEVDRQQEAPDLLDLLGQAQTRDTSTDLEP